MAMTMGVSERGSGVRCCWPPIRLRRVCFSSSCFLEKKVSILFWLEKKRKVIIEHGSTTSPKNNNKKQHGSASASSSSTATTTTPTFSKPAPSNLLSKLASFTEANKRTRAEAELDGEGDGKQHVERSISFDERVTTCKKKTMEADKLVVEEDNASDETGKPPKRDSRLALVEELEPGPYEFPLLADDPEFEKLEPHSGIRLVCVCLFVFCCPYAPKCAN